MLHFQKKKKLSISSRKSSVNSIKSGRTEDRDYFNPTEKELESFQILKSIEIARSSSEGNRVKILSKVSEEFLEIRCRVIEKSDITVDLKYRVMQMMCNIEIIFTGELIRLSLRRILDDGFDHFKAGTIFKFTDLKVILYQKVPILISTPTTVTIELTSIHSQFRKFFALKKQL